MYNTSKHHKPMIVILNRGGGGGVGVKRRSEIPLLDNTQSSKLNFFYLRMKI